jgi:hypothetical protein
VIENAHEPNTNPPVRGIQRRDMQMAQVKQNSDPNSISTVGTASKLGNQHQLNSEPLKFDTEDHGEIFGATLI